MLVHAKSSQNMPNKLEEGASARDMALGKIVWVLEHALNYAQIFFFFFGYAAKLSFRCLIIHRRLKYAVLELKTA